MAKRSFTKTLAFIGGIFTIIEGIIGIIAILAESLHIPGYPVSAVLYEWYIMLIAIFFGFLVLISCDAFKKMKGLPYNGWLLLFLGIICMVLSPYHFGGALVVIAAILWIIGKK